MQTSNSPKKEIDRFSVSSDDSTEQKVNVSESSELFIDTDENTTPILENIDNVNLGSPTTIMTKWETLKAFYDMKEPEPLEPIKEETHNDSEDEECLEDEKKNTNSYLTRVWNYFTKSA